MININRIAHLNGVPMRSSGRYVLYWMQQSQRANFNPALEYAIAQANELDCGVVVVFGLYDKYPEANERHFAFMLEGLKDVAEALHSRGIKFVVRYGQPDKVCLELAQQAKVLVCDRGYMRPQKTWYKQVEASAPCRVVQIEGDVVVPVRLASNKRDYAARTLRPKINRLIEDHLEALETEPVKHPSLSLRIRSDVDLRDPQRVLAGLNIDRSVHAVQRFLGGSEQAQQRLSQFLSKKLGGYAQARNDPSQPQCSNLSPYLHFGQISPVDIVLQARNARHSNIDDCAVFIEELVVRRELAMNFVEFEPKYDSFSCLPPWALETLERHSSDEREHIYTRKQLDQASTHDPYWNAAMNEMRCTGYMHNYMRMYWGKKVLEWSNTPQGAFRTLLALNNKYFIDGRDANSYCGVGWIFGLHDRAWTRRPVFGTVRYMNANGLKRKFDIEAYVRWTQSLPD